jgi:hypothetical protein
LRSPRLCAKQKNIARGGAENAEDFFIVRVIFSLLFLTKNSFLQYFFNAEGAEGRKEQKFFKTLFPPIPRFPFFRVKK